MQFVKNELLETIKVDYLGNSIRDGRFLNYQKVNAPKLKEILHWRFTNNPDRIKKKANPWTANVIPIINLENKNRDRIIWLGHASFLITLNQKNILIDPVLGDIPLVKRLVGVPCVISDLLAIDYILISHAHFDHLDRKSLVQITKQNPGAQIYCGLGTTDLLLKFGIKNTIVEAAWYQKFASVGVDIYFMPALHWSKRSLRDRNIRLWGSFIIKSADSSVFFMGDSGYSPHFKEIGGFFSPIDYCLMGIGAYTPSYILQSSHVNPYEAVQAFHDLGGLNLFPMHYGTYDLTDEPMAEPLHIIEHLVTQKQINGTVIGAQIGEIIYI